MLGKEARGKILGGGKGRERICLNSFPHLSPSVRTLEYYSTVLSLFSLSQH